MHVSSTYSQSTVNHAPKLLRNTKISICQMHYDDGWNSSVRKVYKFYSQQLIAAALQVTPLPNCTTSFTTHYSWQASIIITYVVVAPKLGRAAPGLNFDGQSGAGRQKTKSLGRAKKFWSVQDSIVQPEFPTVLHVTYKILSKLTGNMTW